MIDTRQVFRNGTVVLPDSDTRVDAELCNDSLSAIINIETALGANIQGAYGSLAARLDAIEAGGSGGTPLTNVIAFTNQTVVSLPGSAHQQGQQALLYAVYDAATPRNVLSPGTFSMYATTYNAVVTFAVSQSGVFMVAALSPDYVAPFTMPATPPYEVTIPGSTHGLGQTYLFVQAYDAATPAQAISLGSVRVHPTTKDVTLASNTPMSGTVLLAVGSPRHVQAFTSQTTVTVLGSTHGLASANLLHQVYDDSAQPVLIEAGSLSVHPTTFDVVLTFAVPQSGTLVLAPVPTTTPVVFAVRRIDTPLPAAFRTARQGPDDYAVVQLQRRVEALSAQLATLETAYQTLLLQQGRVPLEEPVS